MSGYSPAAIRRRPSGGRQSRPGTRSPARRWSSPAATGPQGCPARGRPSWWRKRSRRSGRSRGALGHFLRRLLFAAIGGRSVARRGFRRGGRRLGRRRTTGEHGHNHHQRQDDGDALLQGHGNSSFCFLAHARGNMNSLCPYSLKVKFTKIFLKNQVLFRCSSISFHDVKRSWEERWRKGISFRL